MEFLEKNAPFDLLTKYEQIHRALVRLRQMRQNLQAPARSASDFPHAPTVVDSWQVLYINGPTGLGKTQWRAVFYLKLLSYLTVTSYGLRL